MDIKNDITRPGVGRDDPFAYMISVVDSFDVQADYGKFLREVGRAESPAHLFGELRFSRAVPAPFETKSNQSVE